MRSVVCCDADSQFDGLVPHDDVAGQDKGLDVDDVSVASLRAHVQPLALERKVAEGILAEKERRETVRF